MTPNRPHKQSLLAMLIAGYSTLDQQRIGRALKSLFPALHIAYSSTTQQTLDYLETVYAELFDIPSLLLLEAELIKTPADWQWLSQLKACYPLLIVVVLSNGENFERVATCYHQGVHAVLTKPKSEESWSEWARGFMQYWGETASMPRIPV